MVVKAPLNETPIYHLDGWQGNATDAWDVDWIITEESGWSTGAPVRIATADRSGIDGGLSGPVLRGARLIVLTGVCIAPDRKQMLQAKDRLNAVATGRSAGLYVLVVEEDHMARQAEVRHFAEPKMKDINSHAFAFELSLRADDPLRYGQDVISETIGLPVDTSGQGLVFPVTFPVTFGSADVSLGGSVFLPNDGTAAVYPTLVFTGPVENPTAYNITDLDHVQKTALSISLTTDQSLTVDMAARTVLLNNSLSKRAQLLPGSSWWQIEPGGATVAYSAATAGGGASRLTVIYRPAWR
jgi:hypothetical protein